MKKLLLALPSLAAITLASCVATADKETFREITNLVASTSTSNYPPCYVVISGNDWGYKIEFEHENAHCWGWIHPQPTSDPRYVIPPKHFSLAVLGTYPNIVYPAGRITSYYIAKKLCDGSSACQSADWPFRYE